MGEARREANWWSHPAGPHGHEPIFRPRPPRECPAAPVAPPVRPHRRHARNLALIAVTVLTAGLLGGGFGAAVQSERQGGHLTLHQVSATGTSHGEVASQLHSALPGVVYLYVRTSTGTSTGTGVLLDTDGHILTNNHVAAPDGEVGQISVTFSTGQSHPAQLVGRDVGTDLAVLRVSGVSGLQPAVLGDSDDVQVGDRVLAIGAPYGLQGTVTAGILSAKDRPIVSGGGSSGSGSGPDDGRSYLDALQTDAPINPGNSGGPLLDAAGAVIGINTAIRSSDPDATDPYAAGAQTGSIGLGFAIPIDQATGVAGALIAHGRATHPVLGVTVTQDAVVRSVAVPHSVLRPGDGLLAVDGAPVTSADELTALVRGRKPGTETLLTVRRDGTLRRLVVPLHDSGEGLPAGTV
ncbi:S1C family serine protease [Streptacidiphilus monticola]|uniref:S1C family serine protease n=1 Tax=Streptacidiphilus monticola TaxID=2161674 RepID=A0ABW1G1Y5_9ACTN